MGRHTHLPARAEPPQMHLDGTSVNAGIEFTERLKPGMHGASNSEPNMQGDWPFSLNIYMILCHDICRLRSMHECYIPRRTHPSISHLFPACWLAGYNRWCRLRVALRAVRLVESSDACRVNHAVRCFPEIVRPNQSCVVCGGKWDQVALA